MAGPREQKDLRALIPRFVAGAALAGAATWLLAEGGYEPVVTTLGCLLAFIYALARKPEDAPQRKSEPADNAYRPPDPTPYKHFHLPGPITNSWIYGKRELLATTFGSGVESHVGGRFRGNGIQIHVISGNELETIWTHSEADYECEYWFDAPCLHIVEHSYDPRRDGPAPFVMQTLDLSQESIGFRPSLVMRPDLTSSLPAIAADIRANACASADEMTELERQLYSLRNVGISCPSEAVATLKELKDEGRFDGYLAEIVSSIIKELQTIAEHGLYHSELRDTAHGSN